ncbi:MAG TPA: hypothetical protein VF796_20305, partial [Humisphaera sp.]
MPTRALAAVTVLLALLAAPAFAAEDVTLSAAVPLKTPRKTKDDRAGPADKVEVAMFIPGDSGPIRGAVVNLFNAKQVEQKHWQAFCRVHSLALIGSNHFGVRNEEYASSLQAALDEFAAKANRPELKTVPLCLVGMSAGSGMARQMAMQAPDRTVAVAAVCLEVAPDADALRPIPFLNVFGEKDGKQMPLHLEKLPVQRKAGANWGIAVQWGRGHEFALANNLVMPFFEDALRQRLPEKTEPGKPPVLAAAPQAGVWLGDVSGWAEKKHVGAIAPASDYKGDATAAAWFPSARIAHAWRALVSADKAVQIKEPAGLGDGQPFSPLPAGKPVKVVVEATKPGVTKVELFDGDVRLGAKDGSAGEFEVTLTPGSHPLIAVAHTAEGPVYSKPNT